MLKPVVCAFKTPSQAPAPPALPVTRVLPKTVPRRCRCPFSCVGVLSGPSEAQSGLEVPGCTVVRLEKLRRAGPREGADDTPASAGLSLWGWSGSVDPA